MTWSELGFSEDHSGAVSRCRTTREEANPIIQAGSNSSLVALIAVAVLKVVQFWIYFEDWANRIIDGLELGLGWKKETTVTSRFLTWATGKLELPSTVRMKTAEVTCLVNIVSSSEGIPHMHGHWVTLYTSLELSNTCIPTSDWS